MFSESIDSLTFTYTISIYSSTDNNNCTVYSVHIHSSNDLHVFLFYIHFVVNYFLCAHYNASSKLKELNKNTVYCWAQTGYYHKEEFFHTVVHNTQSQLNFTFCVHNFDAKKNIIRLNKWGQPLKMCVVIGSFLKKIIAHPTFTVRRAS